MHLALKRLCAWWNPFNLGIRYRTLALFSLSRGKLPLFQFILTTVWKWFSKKNITI
uniref:Uncharacterized protein n=1 Tax=Arundo donax TaxID=35708 RepID=A0A0A9A1E4_ARUDO